MMEFIKFDFEKKYIKEFINLTKKIYSLNQNTEDEKELLELLKGEHPLSKYFKLDKFLILKDKRIVGRFVITTYPGDNIAYLGFFECINNEEVAKYLFDVAYDFAKENGFEKIVGPVNASFWIKYRLKINKFEKFPYTSEPYNKDYYLKLFENNKFEITQKYTSNLYREIEDEFSDKKSDERYKRFIEKGYKIESPKKENFEQLLTEFYYLITDLYSKFPIYKNIEIDDFIEMFKSYKYILNMPMVKFAYLDGKMVGFFISVPDYSNKVYHLNLLNIIKVLKIKKKPKKYIMLYVGVDKKHKGLGNAMTYSIIKELKTNKAQSIGALVRAGKETNYYARGLITDNYDYALFERKIEK